MICRYEIKVSRVGMIIPSSEVREREKFYWEYPEGDPRRGRESSLNMRRNGYRWFLNHKNEWKQLHVYPMWPMKFPNSYVKNVRIVG